jgi:signal transduction histidine kinase
LDKVLCSILEQIRKVIPFEGADILLVEGITWQVATFLGFENFPAIFPNLEKSYTFDGYPLLQQVCASHQMLILDPVNEYPGWRSNPDLAWVRSFAAVPLINNGNPMGIIELYSERHGAFDQGTANRLAAFTAPAALALHNARVYQAESEARRIAETMRASAQALSQTLDLDHVINALLDHIRMIVNCDTSGLTLMEGEERWALRALRGYNAWAEQEEIPRVPLDEISAISEAQMPHKPIIVQNKTSSTGQGNGRTIHSWAVLPILVHEKVIGFVELGKAGKEMFRPEYMRWAEALVSGASVAIQNAWLFDQVRSSSIRLQSLARKLVELQEKERYHIARELHDEAGQVLSSLKLSLGQLEQDPDCPPHVSQRLLHLKSIADGVLEDLHRLAMDLRPVALDHLGLVAALEQLANQVNSEGLSVKFKALGMGDGRLPQDMETSLYRIVQEALTNVLHHAHACNIGILLERSGGKLKLFVEDDGIGFAPDHLENDDRLGLVGMRERAEMFGGSLSIESSPGSGTSINVEVPDADSYSHYG